jgi:alpha-L-fucosidase 2
MRVPTFMLTHAVSFSCCLQGPCDWFQNTRLPYYHMLASGDLDGMKSLFEFYGSFLDVSQYRASRWFPELENDAAFFPEVVQQFGAYCDTQFGANSTFIPEIPPTGITPALEPNSPYLRYHREGGLELSMLALDWFDHSEDSKYFERVRKPLLFPISL